MVKFKKTLIIFATLVLWGCSYESTPQFIENDGYFEYSVLSEVNATKTTINDQGSISSFTFSNSDKIGLFIGDLHTNCKLTCTDATTGTFTTKIKALGVSGSNVSYCSYYPFSDTVGSSAMELSSVLPRVQNAPFDPSADFLVANPIQAKYDEEAMPSLSFSFSNHLFGIVKLSVKDGSSEFNTEKILSIGLRSSSDPLTGKFCFDATDPNASAVFSPEPDLTSKMVSVEYPEEVAPVLGHDQVHSVYAVVNPASFAAGDLSLVVSTSNYVFTIPTKIMLNIQRNQVSVLPGVDLSSASVSKRDRIQTIVLWGDSITGPGLLKWVQNELGPNWNVIRCGVAGDSARNIAARQGGLPMVTGAQFTLPASSAEYVNIDNIYSRLGNPGAYSYQAATHKYSYDGYSALNPLIINGIECEISYDDTQSKIKIRRVSDGVEDVIIPEHSDVSTFGAREYAAVDVIVVYMGTNERPSDASNDAYLISLHNAMKSHLTNPDAKMFVYGFHQSTTDYPKYWTSDYVFSYTAAFGNLFVDLRTLGGGLNAIPLMMEMGQIEDESEISSDDLVYINRGDWPISWFRSPQPDVHPTYDLGNRVMAILLRRRMDELGLL